MIEVTGKVREVFLDQGRVYTVWHSFKWKDWVDVLRCYHSYGYGHGEFDCKIRNKVCRKCGEQGHGGNRNMWGNNVRRRSTCRNCKAVGKEFGHSVFSGMYSIFVEQLSEVRKFIYGP